MARSSRNDSAAERQRTIWRDWSEAGAMWAWESPHCPTCERLQRSCLPHGVDVSNSTSSQNFSIQLVLTKNQALQDDPSQFHQAGVLQWSLKQKQKTPSRQQYRYLYPVNNELYRYRGIVITLTLYTLNCNWDCAYDCKLLQQQQQQQQQRYWLRRWLGKTQRR